jgi:signal transduction histidine kinase
MQNCPTRILLIEDDFQDVDLIEELLTEVQQFQVSIEHVDRLVPSLEYLRRGEIDLVLLDLSLPDSQGLDTFRQVYAQCSEVPIIVLSGLTDEQVAVAALQEGAQDYLVKGQFDSNLLVRAIRYAIERQRLLLTLMQQTQTIQASEQQLRTIITKNADGILIVDRNNVIRFVNPAAESLLRRKAEELQGEVFGFPLAVGETTELDIPCPSGQTAAVEVQVVELNWEGETAYLASLRDITIRKHAEDTLRRALEQEKELSELKSRIIATISHEYRTPLTTIASSAELLERYRHRWDNQKQLKHFQRIQASVQHMTALVNDVLFVNKAEFEKLEFNPEPLKVVPFFQEIIEDLQCRLGEQHSLRFTSSGNCPQALLDAKLLRQILTNLLSNAIKYSPEGGKVQLRLSCEDNQVIFQVEDEGIGIPKAEQDNLFKSFSRASNVGAIAGTGLGLSIVKKCVDLHGGEIAVESEPSVRTTFTISLPVNPIPASASS